MPPAPAQLPFVAMASDWPALDALLDRALDVPADQRLAWVDALESEPLRDTLRRLLQMQAKVETGSFLGALPPIADLLSSAPDPHEAEAGTRVGPYQLVRELGRGGMGAVWLADRVDGQLHRRVALKLPRLVWGRDLAERLAREREILASLEHVHIARLYDAGVDSQGRPYFAMEYVDGLAIDAYCSAHEPGPDGRIRLLLQVCAAVAHAHSRLVIHRDIKPGNILVTGDGQVRLLDFGIAKAMEGDHTEETALTRLSGRALTLDYASPEQIRGEPLGTASDVYSLAVVAFELLTGARPYRLKRGSAAELEEAIANADAPQASEVATSRVLKKQLRGDLDAILNKALKKSRAQRYPTVDAFADDLQRYLNGDAVQARPESRLYLARKFLRRHRLPVAALSAVLVALVAGLSVALWQAQAARAQARMAEQAVDREGAVKMMYMDTLSMAAGWDRDAFAKPGAFSLLLRERLADFEKRFQDRPEQRLGLLEAVAVQLPFFGDYEGSLEVGQRYLALLKQTNSDSWRLLRAHLGNGRALRNLGRPDEAERVLQQGLDDVAEDVESLNNRVAVMSELGKTRMALGKREEGRQVLLHASRHLGALKEVTDGSVRWDVRSALARLDMGYDDPAALRAMRSVHDEYLLDPHAQPSSVGMSHLLMGTMLVNVGRSDAAEAHLKAALLRFRENYGRTDRDTITTLGRLASAMAAQGRYAQARQLLAEARAELTQQPGPETARLLAALAARQIECELAHGDLEAAARLAREVDPVASRLVSGVDRIVSAVTEAEVLRRLGRAEQSLPNLEGWLQALPATARAAPEAFQATLALVESRLATGDPSDARQQLDTLLATMRQQQATRTWLYREAAELAALSLAERGQAAAAVAMLNALDGEQQSADLQPPSKVQRADSAMRRARVLLADGRRQEAATAAMSLAGDLIDQHPQSARLQAADQLRSALGL